MTRTLHHPCFRLACRGFTLAEVLVALAVFALGFVAVAAIFPTAILMQRETVRQVQGEQFADSAEAAVLSRGFRRADVEAAAPADSGTQVVFQAPAVLADWALKDRSYLAQMADSKRRLFWVPVFFDADPSPNSRDWRVYLFIVGRTGADTYTGAGGANGSAGAFAGDPTHVPRVRGKSSSFNGNQISGGSAPDLRPGNKVVDQWGRIYTVASVSGGTATLDGNVVHPTTGATTGNADFWYAVKGGGTNRSTFVDVRMLANSSSNRLIR